MAIGPSTPEPSTIASDLKYIGCGLERLHAQIDRARSLADCLCEAEPPAQVAQELSGSARTLKHQTSILGSDLCRLNDQLEVQLARIALALG